MISFIDNIVKIIFRISPIFSPELFTSTNCEWNQLTVSLIATVLSPRLPYNGHVGASDMLSWIISFRSHFQTWSCKVCVCKVWWWYLDWLRGYRPYIHSKLQPFWAHAAPSSVHNLMHYIDVIMTTMTSQITSLTVVYSIVNSGADQSKHQSSASLAFVRGIRRDRWIPRTKGQ